MATTAEIYAQAKRDAAANELNSMYGNLESAYNQQVEAANVGAQNALNQLTQAAQNYQQNYQQNAQQAYINKMLGANSVENQLNRLGLQNAGYGVSQRLANEAAYGQNLTNLQRGLATDLSNLDLKRGDINSNLVQTLANLGSNYASNQNSTAQYMANYLQSVYDKAYAQKYQEQQDAAANSLAYAKLAAKQTAAVDNTQDNSVTNNQKGNIGTLAGSVLGLINSLVNKGSNTNGTQQSTQQTTTTPTKGMYVPSASVKKFINMAALSKTNDQKQNLIAMALNKGDISEKDLDYILSQLGL